MADLNMVLKEAQKLNGSIRSLLRLSTYEDYDDLSGLSRHSHHNSHKRGG